MLSHITSKKFNVNLEWLLSEDDIDVPTIEFSENDLATKLNKLRNEINTDTQFEGTPLTDESVKLAYDCIDVVKKLIRQNL